MIYLLALLLGVVAGLRTFTAPAAVSWAAQLGWLSLGGTSLAFLGYAWTPWLLTLAAIAELVVDQLPGTPDRTEPKSLAARIVSSALSGAAIGAAGGSWWLGAMAGIVGAVPGSFAGLALRRRLAAAFGRDMPAALSEDAVAILGAWLIVMAAR